jgi:hypothetical protein
MKVGPELALSAPPEDELLMPLASQFEEGSAFPALVLDLHVHGLPSWTEVVPIVE